MSFLRDSKRWVNNRDHDQKYYLSYEDGETHFWVNDGIKSQLSFPIGGIIAFPVNANPSRNSDNWLECNGQSFNTSKYPELYKILGSNKVPNYQGMFLRGYGSQNFTYTFNNVYSDKVNTSTFSSGAIGRIQGDASRRLRGRNHVRLLGEALNMPDWINPSFFNSYFMDPTGREDWAIAKSGNSFFGDAVYRTPGGPLDGDAMHLKYIYFSYNPKHYRYRLKKSGSGEDASYELEEYTSPVENNEAYKMAISKGSIGIDNGLVMPVDNEFRPINIAVKYYIRAR